MAIFELKLLISCSDHEHRPTFCALLTRLSQPPSLKLVAEELRIHQPECHDKGYDL